MGHLCSLVCLLGSLQWDQDLALALELAFGSLFSMLVVPPSLDAGEEFDHASIWYVTFY